MNIWFERAIYIITIGILVGIIVYVCPRYNKCQVDVDVMTKELLVKDKTIDSLNFVLNDIDSTYTIAITNLDSCSVSNNQLRSELFIANYKLGRIEEYCNIVKRNNTQLKYLRGWITRVLEN